MLLKGTDSTAGYRAGATLESLRANSTLPKPAVLLHLLNQIAGAVDFAHGSGAWHGNLEARNIWITSGPTWADHTAKIIDSGAASSTSSVDSAQTQFGTIVYQLLAGTASLPDDGSRLDRLNKTLDARVDSILKRTLSGPRNLPYATCSEFMQELSTALMNCPDWHPAPPTSHITERTSSERSGSNRINSSRRFSRLLAMTLAVSAIVGLIAVVTTRKPVQAVTQVAPKRTAKPEPPVKVDPPKTPEPPPVQSTTPVLVPEIVTSRAAVPAPRPVQIAKPDLPKTAPVLPLKRTQGTMVVSSRPAGAEVKLDGVAVGTTPVTLRVSVGTHRLELISLGRSHHETIVVSGDVITTRAVNWD